MCLIVEYFYMRLAARYPNLIMLRSSQSGNTISAVYGIQQQNNDTQAVGAIYVTL